MFSPLKVGLLMHGFVEWSGGIDFVRMVAASLRVVAPDAELHVLAPLSGPRAFLLHLYGAVSRLASRSPKYAWKPGPRCLEDAFAGTGATLHLIDHGSGALARVAKRLHLDVVMPAIEPIPGSSTPWVGYIYDFQHKYIPRFFSEKECRRRDELFGRMLMDADAVIVNSCEVARDIEKFYPQHRARVYTLPFCPAPNIDGFSVDIEDARRRYDIHGPYFIICNQFWKHKDHATAFQAMRFIFERNPHVSLVCTGTPTDHRFPGYFEQLVNAIDRDGISKCVHFLGLIPKVDQLALIRGSMALIQPTLFEGGPGGGAVYDALALGKRCIVSDISINLEITDPLVTFFKAGSAESLNACMEEVLALTSLPEIEQDPTVLISRGRVRREKCGKILLEAIRFAGSYSERSI